MLKYQSLKIDSWNKLLNTLVSYGCKKEEVISGSIPESTLKKIIKLVSGNGLQIGGFVGLSHCYLCHHVSGNICTIDLNIQHRGITNPLFMAKKLVDEFNLCKNSMLICGDSVSQMKIFYKLGVKFDFIILDGNHGFDEVLKEIYLSDQILKYNGYLILDDIDFWQGPKLHYKNFPLKYEKIFLDDRAGVFKKPDCIKL